MFRWVTSVRIAVAFAMLMAGLAIVGPGGAPAVAQVAPGASVFCGGATTNDPQPGAPMESFTRIAPERFVDTRDGTGGVDEAVPADCTLRFEFDAADVPEGAAAAAISLTAVADERGFFTVFPCLAGRPGSSNLNSRGSGIATPNLAVAALDANGAICVYTNQTAQLIIDVTGWWGAGDQAFASIEPQRVEDTRESIGFRLPAFNIRNVAIGDAVAPADSTAVLVNATVTDAVAQGFLRVFPCGQPPPETSNLNFLAGESRAVAVIVGLGAGGEANGQLCFESNQPIHAVIDVMGYYAPAPQFGPTADLQTLVGERLVDSRNGTGGWTSKMAAGEVRTLDPVAAHPAADEAAAALLNIVATEGESPGHLRVYPCDPDVPLVSNLNFVDERSVSNLVPVELSDARTVCVYAHQPAHVVIDLVGVMAVTTGSLAERISPSRPTWPPFDVDAVDYGVECASSTTSIDFEIDPLPGARGFVAGEPVGLDGEPLSVPLTVDDTTIVTVRRGADVHTYHFRCLPPDFPRLEVERPGERDQGWYLTTFGQGPAPFTGRFVAILDEYGGPVWYKRITGTDRGAINFDRRPDGTLRVTEIGDRLGLPTEQLRTRIFDLDGALTGPEEVPGPGWDDEALPIDHHEYIDLPGGGAAVVSYPLRQPVDLTALNTRNPPVPCTPPAGETDCFFADDWILDSEIVELDAGGSVGWQWSTKDHFDDIGDAAFPLRFGRWADEPSAPANPPPGHEIDFAHINSMQRLSDGDYVVSARHLDAVFRVDRATDALDWVVGGSPGTNPARLTILGDPFNGVLRPHDARFDESTNVLTVHDNRSATSDPGRVVAYQIDTTAKTATMIWQLLEPQNRTSPAQGGARVAADGSLLVTWGGLQPSFEEYGPLVSGERELLLSISQVPPGNSYRILKHPVGAFDRAELRAAAGGGLEVP